MQEIVADVRENGDEALHRLTEQFDDVPREGIRVSNDEIASARETLDAEKREAIDHVIENVREFHEEQLEHVESFEREFRDGVRLGQRVVPVESAGAYVPGGRHPLVASPAMSIVPARVASVERMIACAPPQSDGSI